MNILFLEDSGSGEATKRSLEDAGHTVFLAIEVADADSYLQSDSIDCLVVDLEMSAMGLTDAAFADIGSCRFTGWAWLKHHAFPCRPDLRQRTVFHTAFLAELISYLGARHNEIEGIRHVPKSYGPDALIRCVNGIAARLKVPPS